MLYLFAKGMPFLKRKPQTCSIHTEEINNEDLLLGLGILLIIW